MSQSYWSREFDKLFPEDDHETLLFYVSNKGRIRNDWSDKSSRGELKREYCRHRRGKFDVAVHRAVYVIFKGLPKIDLQNMSVDHINSNTEDNRIENLDFITFNEQIRRSWANNQNRKTNREAIGKPVEARKIHGDPSKWTRYPTEQAAADACDTTQANVCNCCLGRAKSTNGYKFRFADTGVVPLLDGEEWRNAIVPGKECEWMVSNLGRVKSATGIISYGWKKGDDYRKVTSKLLPVFVHNLVGYTFIGPPPKDMINPTIDHIDKNPENNNLNNLHWATKREQALNQKISVKVDKKLAVHARKIGEIDYVKFESLNEAAEICHTSRKKIIACCRGDEKSCNGYEFKSDAEEYINLEGEVWMQFFVSHFEELKKIPEPVRDVENDKKRRLEYRKNRTIKNNALQQKNKKAKMG